MVKKDNSGLLFFLTLSVSSMKKIQLKAKLNENDKRIIFILCMFK